MVNAGNVARVIAAIKGEAEQSIGFNMGAYIGATVHGVLADKNGRQVKHVACVAGHAYLLATGATIEEGLDTDADDIDLAAAEYLGLDMDQAAALFYDLPREIELTTITTEQTVEALEGLLRTGEVMWNIEVEPVRIAA